jgi:hypothetical protein
LRPLIVTEWHCGCDSSQLVATRVCTAFHPPRRFSRSASNIIAAVALNVSAIAMSTTLTNARVSWVGGNSLQQSL